MARIPLQQLLNHIAARILRFFNILGGNIALSPRRCCIYPNMENNTPNVTRSTITRQSFQPYLLPPHCKAIMKHVIDGTITKVSRMFIRFSFSFNGSAVSGFGSGSLKPYHVRATHSKPNGMLIPKHARQLNASISAPPTTGADTKPID